jgi:uncharacterized lipoprotein YddW (UPF0748 family)
MRDGTAAPRGAPPRAPRVPPVPRATLLAALLLAGLLPAGCGDDPAEPAPAVVAISLDRTQGAMLVGDTLRVSATALSSTGAAVPGAAIVWASSRADVATVDGGLVRGVAPGTAEITATHGDIRATAAITVQEDVSNLPPLPEVRGVWLSRFDWATQADIVALMESIASAGFNLVYFQVRGEADAYYRSAHEPWALRFGGNTQLGRDPGWDPLRVALDAAHARGLQLHAWINAFTGWQRATPPPESDPRHAFLQHPEWAMVHQNGTPMPYSTDYRWLTPGHPGVRHRLAAVAADIARSYAVDGVHLDYIRYPDRNHSYDSASLAGYDAARAAEPALTYDQFRRRMVTDAVRLVADSVRAARPAARVSAAVWGIYDPRPGWGPHSSGMNDRLQEARVWAAQGYVDALAPMVYWGIKPTYGEHLDFRFLVDDHVQGIPTRHVYVGITAQNHGITEISNQIEYARTAGAKGVVIFSAGLLRSANHWAALKQGPFRRAATIPPMPWRGN